MAKKSKKMSISLFITLLVVVVGAVCGFFVTQKITENDKFEIIANKEIEIKVGEEYIDNLDEVVVISFGKDISDKVVSESNFDNSVPGQYYIKYTVNNFRFKGIERFRIINVVEEV